MALVTLILGEQQASAVEIYVTDPVFDDDPDRVRVTFDGKGLTFDAAESERIASGLTDVLNGLDETAEDRNADSEERKYARQSRDALTALVRRIRKVGGKHAGGKRRRTGGDRPHPPNCACDACQAEARTANTERKRVAVVRRLGVPRTAAWGGFKTRLMDVLGLDRTRGAEWWDVPEEWKQAYKIACGRRNFPPVGPPSSRPSPFRRRTDPLTPHRRGGKRRHSPSRFGALVSDINRLTK